MLCRQGQQREKGPVPRAENVPGVPQPECVAYLGAASGRDQGLLGPVQTQLDRRQADMHAEDSEFQV